MLARDRSGDTGASTKARVGELDNQVDRLTVEAAELQRFTQDYMVKASSDKLKVRFGFKWFSNTHGIIR